MTKRSLAAPCCLLWGPAVPALAEDAPPLLVRVTDGTGKPVAGATVRALPEQGYPEKPEVAIREETSAEGTARISGLPADWLSDVLVEREGHAPELRSHAPGQLFASAWTRPDGSFSAAVPEGDVKVSVRHGARERTQPVGAETGPVTGLEIEP